MRKKNGFTTIELLLSFALVMVIVLSMFGVVFNFKNKEQIASIRNTLLTYKTTLTKVIQDDITKNKISGIVVAGPNSSVTIQFVDGKEATLSVNTGTSTITYKGRNDPVAVNYPVPNIDGVYVGERVGEPIFFAPVRTLESVPVNGTRHNIMMSRVDLPVHHPDFKEDFGIHLAIIKDVVA